MNNLTYPIKILDMTSDDTRLVSGDTRCVYYETLSSDEQQEASDGGGLVEPSAALDPDTDLTLADCDEGDIVLVRDEPDGPDLTVTWWLSEIIGKTTETS